MSNIFANRLRTMLTKRNMPQAELARQLLQLESPEKIEELLQSKKSTISRWLRGHVERPDSTNLENLSIVLNVTENYLIGTLKHPYPRTDLKLAEEKLTKEMTAFSNKMYLYKYIESCLGYDLMERADSLGGYSFDNGVITLANGEHETYYNLVEQEVRAFITARLGALGVPKKAGENNGSIQK